VFLEANVRPSVEDGTEFRLAADLAGIHGPDLLALLLAEASRRHGGTGLPALVRSAARRAARALRNGAVASEDPRGVRPGGARRAVRRRP